MIVQVTASRYVEHDAHAATIRQALLWAVGSAGNITMHDGGAAGGDLVCRSQAIELGWDWEAFDPDWEHCDPDWRDPIGKVRPCTPAHRETRASRPAGYCPTAGFRRNQAMIDATLLHAGRKVCVTFPIPARGSYGTADCLERAWRACIPTIVIPLEPVKTRV